MTETTDRKAASGADSSALPTRQRNALRLLLDKPDISPAEVAALDYRVLERAPGIGRKSIDLIGTWLNGHGYAVLGRPAPVVSQRDAQRQRKLERAIDYLRGHGYEVHRRR